MIKPSDVRYIVVHCSATKHSATHVDAKTIDRWHRDRGWSGLGYHAVITRDGQTQLGRRITADSVRIGAHVSGHNAHSVGVCLAGGLDERGNSTEGAEHYDPRQLDALRDLLKTWTGLFPNAEVLGHRDLSPDRNRDGAITRDEWLKTCPCFDARRWWASQ